VLPVSLVLLVLLVSLDVDEALSVELAAAVAALVELAAVADETVLLSLVSVGATAFCWPAAWNSAPRNC
jgi:hypothetical protein